jgi:hypothetical protein
MRSDEEDRKLYVNTIQNEQKKKSNLFLLENHPKGIIRPELNYKNGAREDSPLSLDSSTKEGETRRPLPIGRVYDNGLDSR